MDNCYGMETLTDFIRDRYLREYIPDGGSKIKFVTGRQGSGKTSFLKNLEAIAAAEGYQTVGFSAEEIWLNDFSRIYSAVICKCDMERCIRGCAECVVRGMGYDPRDIPEGNNFCDYLSSKGENDALARREIRNQIKEIFLKNPYLDNNFALAMCMLTGSTLGHPVLEPQNRDILYQWLCGDTTVKLANLRTLGLSPSKINRLNARHMLRSLAEVLRIGGSKGLLITVDDMEIVMNKTGIGDIRYTRARREDTYESIRQLIDDIDSMRNIMFVFAFDKMLTDDEKSGLKAYQALWMRMQNEIKGSRFNYFSDLIDLDRMEQEMFTPEMIVDISKRMIESMESVPGPLSIEQAQQLLDASATGAFGIPLMIRRAMLAGGTANV